MVNPMREPESGWEFGEILGGRDPDLGFDGAASSPGTSPISDHAVHGLGHASPAGRSTRRLILVLAVAAFASTFAWRSIEPLVGVLAEAFGRDVHTVALLSAAFALPYALTQLVLGPVGEAAGKERVMSVCLVIMTVALVACSLAPNLASLFGLRVVAGAAAGGVVPLSLSLLGDRVPIERRQTAIARFVVALIIGQFMGSSVAGVIEGIVGWRGVFAINALVGAIGLLTTSFGFERRPAVQPHRLDFRQAMLRYRGIIADPRARILFSAVFVEGIAVFGAFPHFATLIRAAGGTGARETGFALAGFTVGGLLYATLVGQFVRRLGTARMLLAGGSFCALALLALGAATHWQADAAALALLGLGFYMLHNTFQTLVTEVAPTARGSAVALHTCSFFCGQALGVVFFGQAMQGFGQSGAFVICAAVTMILGGTTARALATPSPVPRQGFARAGAAAAAQTMSSRTGPGCE